MISISTDWLWLIGAFAILILMKIFLVRKAYNRKQLWYQSPKDLAEEFTKQKKAKAIADKYKDLKVLDQLFFRNLTIFEIEWNSVSNQKNIQTLIDRIKNAAVLVYTIYAQHDEELEHKIIKNKLNSLRGSFDQQKKFLDEVRKTPFEKVTYLTNLEKMTIDAYIRDICDAFGVEPAEVPYDDPAGVLGPKKGKKDLDKKKGSDKKKDSEKKND